MKITILGLSITSSWGNGHATTYRSLVQALGSCGHKVTFLERDVPWYAEHRDLPNPPYCKVRLYDSLGDLDRRLSGPVEDADLVIVGSYVPEGVQVAEWVLARATGVSAFYDIDTPVTLAALQAGTCEYLSREVIEQFDIYLSFTGGPILEELKRRWGARQTAPLYCAVDPNLYFPVPTRKQWDLGYLGTYSPDRQPKLDELLRHTSAEMSDYRFVVAGPLYPEHLQWGDNIERIAHLPAAHHRRFYNSQRYTLNLTRKAMVRAGYSPSVRLFEAAACATPIISDAWPGLDEFFTPGKEILLASNAADVRGYVLGLSEPERRAIGQRARDRVLAEHTATHRAKALESLVESRLTYTQAVAL
jgi:spore maturation protein CgeB